MPIIEHRKIFGAKEGSAQITLPAGHTIIQDSNEVRMIISNNLVIVTDTKVSMERIVSELTSLVKDLS